MTEQQTETGAPTTDPNSRTWRATWADETRDDFYGSHAYLDNGCLYVMRTEPDGRHTLVAAINPAHARDIRETTKNARDWDSWGGAL